MADVTRRGFLRGLAGGAAALATLGAERVAHGALRPNIILIMADDMGFSDIGCYGSEIRTPNLDRLAARGMRFTHFYNGARCCPTRASLLTGLYAQQAGVGHMVGDRSEELGPAYQGYLNDRCVTLAEVLGPAGYMTLMSGKWHVGEAEPHWPRRRGFDRYFGLISGASNYFKLDDGRRMAVDDDPYVPPEEGFYMTDAFTNHAVGFIDQHGRGDQPFFLYLPYTSPHWPLHAHPEDIERYRGRYLGGWDALRRERHSRQIEMGLVNPEWPMAERDPRAPEWEDAEHKEWEAMRMAVYAAQIDRMDQGIGRVMAQLEGLGIMDNTLIMFLADNGGCAEGRQGNDPNLMPGPKETFMSYGLPWANASNTPFRRYKHWVHEGGIATPFIAHWPDRIRPGAITHEPSHLIDVMATCADLAEAEYPDERNGAPITPLEGKSLRRTFEGRERNRHDAIYWEHEGNRAVLKGRWKLVSQHPRSFELFDMEADRAETKDLANDKAQVVSELEGAYESWTQRCAVAPWPAG